MSDHHPFPLSEQDLKHRIWAAKSLPTIRSWREVLNILNLTDENLTGKSILDIGIGAKKERPSDIQELQGAQVYGIDPGNKALVTHQLPPDNFRVGIAQEIPYDDETFDLVISSHVTHYIDSVKDSQRMLAEMLRVVKADGQVRFTPGLEPHQQHKAMIQQLQSVGIEVTQVGKDSYLLQYPQDIRQEPDEQTRLELKVALWKQYQEQFVGDPLRDDHDTQAIAASLANRRQAN